MNCGLNCSANSWLYSSVKNDLTASAVVVLTPVTAQIVSNLFKAVSIFFGIFTSVLMRDEIVSMPNFTSFAPAGHTEKE